VKERERERERESTVRLSAKKMAIENLQDPSTDEYISKK
jgi:hypothetical protein